MLGSSGSSNGSDNINSSSSSNVTYLCLINQLFKEGEKG